MTARQLLEDGAGAVIIAAALWLWMSGGVA